MRRATAPCNGDHRPRGRPRKEPAEKQIGCAWPAEGRVARDACGEPPVSGLALCPRHAQVLHQEAGKVCAWPNCAVTRPFEVLCPYHLKVARGLLDPYRL